MSPGRASDVNLAGGAGHDMTGVAAVVAGPVYGSGRGLATGSSLGACLLEIFTLLGLSLVTNNFHAFQRAAGANDIIDENDTFAGNQRLVFFIQIKPLGFAGGDGDGFRFEGAAHVRFV